MQNENGQSKNQSWDEKPLQDLLKGTNLYLVGMMGCGKTTIGRIMAQRLQYQFFDTDAVIEQAAGCSISQIFAESGEAAFRELETQVLGQLASHTRLAIATGGGIVLQRKNWSYLHHGVVIWLDVPVEQIFKRIKGSTTRPLLQDPDPKKKLQDILEQRQSLYALADLRISVNGEEPSQQVATRVLAELNKAIQAKLTNP